MSRGVVDGLGVKRHLAGYRIAPRDPRRMMRLAPVAAGYDAETRVDTPVFDQIQIYDQGSVGDCTAQTQRRLSSALVLRQTGVLALFSAFFLYAVTRLREHTPLSEDSGCMIPAVQEAWAAVGMCPEELWPSLDDGSTFTAMPSDEAMAAAAKHRGQLYFHCPDHVTIHASLATGFGVSLGIAVPENMMSTLCAATGEIFLPSPGERILGGHNITVRGYDPDRVVGGEKGCYVIDNSWGDGWGRRGRGYLPKAFLEQGLANDAESPRLMRVSA